MMGFCNNAGPAFLFGVISTQFPGISYTWLIWIIIILSTVFTAMILPGSDIHSVTTSKPKSITLTQAMEKSTRVMAGICGWVIIFRVIIAFLERWFLWMLPATYGAITQILLELANGCAVLNTLDNIAIRFVVCVGGLCMGGLCVLLQTISVSGTQGIGKYIPGKLIQTSIGIILAIPTSYLLNQSVTPVKIVFILLSCLIILLLLSLYHLKRENKCSNLSSAGV